jgi:hypothetical protein
MADFPFYDLKIYDLKTILDAPIYHENLERRRDARAPRWNSKHFPQEVSETLAIAMDIYVIMSLDKGGFPAE